MSSSSTRLWVSLFVCLLFLAAPAAFAEEASRDGDPRRLQRGSDDSPPEADEPMPATPIRDASPVPPWNDIQTILFHPPAIA